jgi:molybdenum cofactor cytidylyltransferase
MIPAIVLAAGESSRMGSPKALLRAPDGRLFVTRIAAALGAAGATDVVVVTGTLHDQIQAALDDAALPVRPRVVRNPDPSRGQLSSLLVGMDAAIAPGIEALLVTLVDVPLVDPPAIAAVVEAWRRTGAPIVRPAIGDRHGHPVLFDRVLFDELRAAPPDAGAKVVVRRHEREIVNVTVADERTLIDIDTPADYAELMRRSTE